MMETNFRRRSAGHTGKLGVVGSSKGSLSPKGTIKKIKQDRKTNERQAQEMCNLNVLIGRLEDRDTQQQAFAMLIESLPDLNPSLVKEVHALIEKNKKPGRSSTRRMLVLLIAALCRCHPMQAAKLLPRILSYACLRLRDRHAKTTDACVILVSAIALYVLPCPSLSLPGAQTGTSPRRQRGDSSTQVPFEAVAGIFTKEANAVGEAATKCLCGLLHPVDFDGVSVPGPSTILAHATRICPFLKTLLADTVAKMDGSTMFSTFSPLFLLLQSACQLARDANSKASFTQLGDEFAPYIASIYDAIEDAFQCGPRDNWILRKRGLELLTLLLDTFALQESAWCISVGAAKEFFQSQLERVRTLVLAGRHDSVSLVREAAIPAVLAFECLEKLCPHSANGVRSIARASYDFVPPDPPGYSFTGKKWAKSVVSSASDARIHTINETEAYSPPGPYESTEENSFDDSEAGDEALPSHDDTSDEDNTESFNSTKQAKLVHTRSGNIPSRNKATANGAAAEVLPLLAENTQEDEKFMDLLMDHAAAPENGDEADKPPSEDERSNADQPSHVQRKGSSLHKETLKSFVAPRIDTPTLPLPQAAAEAVQAVTTLKQFAAKQRTQMRSRHTKHQDIPQISLPKRRSSQIIEAVQDSTRPQSDHYIDYVSDSEGDNNNTATNLELTRAEAALEAAQCDEYELAFRLCIVEDDLELLRRTMMMIKTPCMTMLSFMTCSAMCTAFLSLLDGDEDEDSADVWLVLQWLQQWATDIRDDRRRFDQLDPRVVQALGSKLHEIAMTSTKSSLAAAHVVFLLDI